MNFDEWFFKSGDPMVDRIGNSPDIMWQLQQAYNAGLNSKNKDTAELVKACAVNLQEKCACSPEYKRINRTDPQCEYCNIGKFILPLAEKINGRF